MAERWNASRGPGSFTVGQAGMAKEGIMVEALDFLQFFKRAGANFSSLLLDFLMALDIVVVWRGALCLISMVRSLVGFSTV
jgi:hypothetical protein